jgi:phospholipase C
MDIRHLVVLMLENRSFDCMLGMLYPKSAGFDGLSGEESNLWHKPGGVPQRIGVWNDPTVTATALCIPDPDPGERFTDIHMQICGLTDTGPLNPGVPNPGVPSPGPPSPGPPDPGAPGMGGFVDNYMRQPAGNPMPDPYSVMHYFTPDQVPVISGLARAFGVSDRWHASAPCQTWPNRFFAHTGTAGGHVNNSPTHFPYLMETVFNRLDEVGQSWRIYFHDTPQAASLSRIWVEAPTHFRAFDSAFARDAASGTLPAYSFVEPRYFPDLLTRTMPSDEHPPHNLAYGEALVAAVYNAVRAGPGWNQTLLIITYDEHGGCYDHVVPPPATPPGGPTPDGFDFGSFGVRVPAVIVSPYVRAGSVLRPVGPTPFDHTSIIATLRRLHGFQPLTARDNAAPDLLSVLDAEPTNAGPAAVTAPAVPAALEQVARLAARSPNDLQRSLSAMALVLPTKGAELGAHIARLTAVPDPVPAHPTVADAAADATAHVTAFLGR